jgi:hypothetical protein
MVPLPPIPFTMAFPGSTGSLQAAPQTQSSPSRTHHRQAAEVLELLRPGTFVRLSDQPNDLPPFELLHCRGGRCWIRQQAWGELIQLEVPHRQLSSAA